MMRRTAGLGRGLGALIPPKKGGTVTSGEGVLHDAREEDYEKDHKSTPFIPSDVDGVFRRVSISDIIANPQQPRRHFDHGALEDLVTSIQEHGIIEPLIVTELSDGSYELIAGERRLRAARVAGLDDVPCVVRTASEQDKLELSLIENVQRHDLNPIEEALAYKRLLDEFGMTQDEIGQKVGKSRPQVANTLRLIQLPEEIQQALIDRKISASNARTLLSLPKEEDRTNLFNAMIQGNFTVRQTEARVPHQRRPRETDPNVLERERKLRESLGHRVTVKRTKSGEGEIRIHFFSDEDLNELASRLLEK